MQRLIRILKTADKIPADYRNEYSIYDIKQHLLIIHQSEISNPHVINMRSMLLTSDKEIIKIEKSISHTGDLEIKEDSHSYYANGVPVHNTINIPTDYAYENFKDVYTKVFKSGTIKGVTTYRAGTMTAVLSAESTTKDEEVTGITKTKAPKRPKELPCDINTLMVDGQYWMVIVGLMGNDPYEIFAFPKTGIQIHHKFKTGKLIRVRKGIYNLDINSGDIILEDVTSLFGSNEQEALTRMVSTALRHGADIGFIVEQLQKSEGNIVSFTKSVARTLKTYISPDSVSANKVLDCEVCKGKGTVRMQEGCYVCTNCGASRCS